MSTTAGRLYHPLNGAGEEIWKGFSWPCLFLGCIWYIYKGMWGWGVISLILACSTMGISWLIFPFFANEQHANSLLKRGYLNQKQWNDKRDAGSPREYVSDVANTKKCPACAETIKLEAIRCRFCGEKFDPEDVARQVAQKRNGDSFDNRVLCGDGSCIGVIGPDGRCKVCGKPYKMDE